MYKDTYLTIVHDWNSFILNLKVLFWISVAADIKHKVNMVREQEKLEKSWQ